VSAVNAHTGVYIFRRSSPPVIMTVMVLELKAPGGRDIPALLPLWPTVISYAVSNLFIAIIWINHHHLMALVGPPGL
jgi:uncharacterized membrane protein